MTCIDAPPWEEDLPTVGRALWEPGGSIAHGVTGTRQMMKSLVHRIAALNNEGPLAVSRW